MSAPRPLREITAELRTFDGGDQEAEHARADDLLLEAIERLAPYATETTDEGEAEALAAAFRALGKWYA